MTTTTYGSGALMLLALLVSIAQGTAPTGLSATELKAALTCGDTQTCPPLDAYRVDTDMKPFVVIGTPFRNVVEAAAQARKKYQTLTAADISPGTRAPRFSVHASAYLFTVGSAQATIDAPVVDIEHIVVVTHGPGGEKIHQPTTIRESSESWSNAFGVTKTGTTQTAYFPLRLLRDSGSFLELRVVTSQGDRRYLLDREQRSKMR